MPPAQSAAELSQKLPATILVVEDDVLIRASVAAYLRECGYNVAEAGDTDEALKILACDTRVDLVLCDVSMPHSVDGFALAQWVRRERKAVKVILTSGIAGTAEAADELCDEQKLLPKPYTHEELLRRIRKLLSGS